MGENLEVCMGATGRQDRETRERRDSECLAKIKPLNKNPADAKSQEMLSPMFGPHVGSESGKIAYFPLQSLPHSREHNIGLQTDKKGYETCFSS